MQRVSQAFTDSLAGTVQPVFRADVYYDGDLVASDLPITDGSVTVDSTQTVRGTCQMTVQDPDGLLVPKSRTDPLAPFGSEVNIRAGLIVGGVPEMVSLGWYRIQDDTPSGSWRWLKDQAIPSGASIPITGRDRGAKLSEYPFLTPEAPSKSTVWPEIVRLVEGLVPVTDPGFDTSIPAGSVTYSTDRWQAITDLAKLCSAHPVITPAGTLTLRKDATGSSVWSVTAGADATVGSFQPSMSRDGIYNGVTVIGTDSSGNPITVIATQPDGPMAWGGPYGCVPKDAISDPMLTTLAAVQARAKSELAAAVVGDAQQVDIPTVLNYALEVEDMVAVSIPDHEGVFQVTKLTYPMRGLMGMTVAIPDGWLADG